METSPAKSPPATATARQHNLKLGMTLFGIYLLLYVGFVLINAFAAPVMETQVLAGLNLAIVYGFGLIIAALIMALIYGALCQDTSDEDDAEQNASTEAEGERS